MTATFGSNPATLLAITAQDVSSVTISLRTPPAPAGSYYSSLRPHTLVAGCAHLLLLQEATMHTSCSCRKLLLCAHLLLLQEATIVLGLKLLEYEALSY